MRNQGRSLATIALLAALACARASAAATITVVNLDGVDEGFNDPTPMAPVGGNPETTLGAQRLAAFQAAADVWGAQLASAVPILVGAQMDPLTCSASSAVLGQAGPTTVHRNFAGALVADTYYPQALANKLAGADLSAANDDISATFNSAIGTTCAFPITWYYGLDGAPPGGQIDFMAVVLHEIGHGLGFLTFVNATTGAKLNGFDDTFMLNLEDHSTGMQWPDMSNAERVASAIDTGDLHWTGPAVVANGGILSGGRDSASGHVEMYAPNPLQNGSSVSHFSTSLTPNEVMEPIYTGPQHDPSLARDLMTDIGWDGAATTTTTTTSSTTSTSSSTSSTTTSSTSTTATSSSTSTVTTSSSSTSTPSSTTSSSTSSTSTSTSSSMTSTSTSSTTSTAIASTSTSSSTTSTTTTSTSSSSTSTSTTTSTTSSTSTSSSSTSTSTATSPSTSTTVPTQGAAPCPPEPLVGCRASASQLSAFALREASDPRRNVLRWKLARGGSATRSALGDPVGGATTVRLCLYDASGNAQPLTSAAAPPGGTCGGQPCWKALGGSGYRYRNKAGTPNGLTDARLRLSPVGKTQVLVTGKGARLPMPVMGLSLPVTAQLLVSDGTTSACWDARFESALKNDGTQFRATSQ